MKKTIVAPVGDHLDELYIGIRDFPTQRVILITPEDQLDKAMDMEANLRKMKIPVEINKINSSKGMLWEEMFREIAKVKKSSESEVLVQVSTGDRESRCAATSAAFVNGIKAFGVDGNNEVFMLPILKFSYYRLLSDKKMDILKIIHENKGYCSSLEELSRKATMSLPLIAYHINGTLKAEGLKSMGLIEAEEVKGKVTIKLTTIGRMLLKGYI